MLSDREIDRLIGLCPGYDPWRDADGYYLDYNGARFAVDFIESMCTHVEGPLAGQRFLLEDWQKAIVCNIFGWKYRDKETGRELRRYKEVFIFVPRKNGKTMLASALLLLVLFTDGEPGGQLYSNAAEQNQAALVFRFARFQIECEPELARRAKIYRSYKSIVLKDDDGNETGTSYKALSAEKGTKHGQGPSFVVNDELHAQRTPEVTDELMTGRGARLQPLFIHITTSDYERPNSVCNQKHEYASSVRDGNITDPRFLPVIYEATTADDWTKEETWAKANPNYGVSLQKEYMAEECAKAKRDIAYQNVFKRLHLNIRTEQAIRAIDMAEWDACKTNLDDEELRGLPCWGGLDLGGTRDLAAFALVWPKADTVAVRVWFWCSELARDRQAAYEQSGYRSFAERGLIARCMGKSVSNLAVRKKIVELSGIYDIRMIGIDKWNDKGLGDALNDEDGIKTMEVPQNITQLNEPTKTLLGLVADGGLEHDGDRVLRWCASNLQVFTDVSGNIRPCKPEHGSPQKIDGIAAIVNALRFADLGVCMGSEAGNTSPFMVA